MRTQDRFPARASRGPLYPILIAVGMFCLLGVIGWGAIRLHRRPPGERGDSPVVRRGPVWKAYSPPKGGFTVLMLGDPVTQLQQDGAVTLHLCREGTTQFEVVYVNTGANPGIISPRMLLDFGKKTRATALQGDLTGERDVTADAQEGEEYLILQPKAAGMRDERTRAYLIGNRIFNFTVKGDRAALHSPEVEQFFASIHFPKANAPVHATNPGDEPFSSLRSPTK